MGREVVITCSTGLMEMGNIALATLGGCSESATFTLIPKPPAVVGVPYKTPALLKLSPGGKLPEATFHA